LERETCFIFSLYVLGKSIKKVGDLIKNYQTESISPVSYITLWQDFAECVWKCFCTSSIRDTSYQPFSPMQSLKASSSVCVMHHIHNVWEYGTTQVYRISCKTWENGNQNLWNGSNSFL